MPIHFSTHSDGYHIVRFQGPLGDQEMLDRCRAFYQDFWQPGLGQLSDLSQADFSEITMEGVQRMAKFVQDFKSRHPETSFKTAVYAPTDLPFGLARMYAALVEKSPNLVAVFRDLEEAVDWLTAEAT